MQINRQQPQNQATGVKLQWVAEKSQENKRENFANWNRASETDLRRSASGAMCREQFVCFLALIVYELFTSRRISRSLLTEDRETVSRKTMLLS